MNVPLVLLTGKYHKGGDPAILSSLTDMLAAPIPDSEDDNRPERELHFFQPLATFDGAAPDQAIQMRASGEFAAVGLDFRLTALCYDIDLKDIFTAPHKIAWQDIAPAEADSVLEAAHDFVRSIGYGHIIQTRGGLHLYTPLPTPLYIGAEGRAARALWAFHSKRLTAFGLVPDKQTADWQRCYRRPRVSMPITTIEGAHTQDFLASIAGLPTDTPGSPTRRRELTYAENAALDNPPTDLPEAAALISRKLPRLAAALVRPATPEHLADVYPDLGRNSRLLRAAAALGHALEGTAYWSANHIYHLLRPTAIAFGYDESGRKDYIALLPSQIQRHMNKTSHSHDLKLVIESYAKGPPAPLATSIGTDQPAQEATTSARDATPPPGVGTAVVVEAPPAPRVDPLPVFTRNVRSYTKDMPPEIRTDEETFTFLKLKKRLMLFDDNRKLFCPLRIDGFYHHEFVSLDYLQRTLEAGGMAAAVELTFTPPAEEGKKPGKSQNLSVRALAERYAEKISDQEVTFGPGGTILAPMDNTFEKWKVCYTPIRYNLRLKPTYSQGVSEWLKAAMPFREERDEFLHAILALARPDSGPTSIVIIGGVPGSGKSLTFRGIEEMFSPCAHVPLSCYMGAFQDGLDSGFVLVADDGIDVRGHENMISETMRRLVEGDTIYINPKHQAKRKVHGLYRLIVTCNDTSTEVDKIFGNEPLNSPTVSALASRIATFQFSPEAAGFFLSRPPDFTRGWCHKAGAWDSDFVLAQHLLWEEQRLIREGKIEILPSGKYKCQTRLIYQAKPSAQAEVEYDTIRSDVEGAVWQAVGKILNCEKIISPTTELNDQGLWVTTRDVLDALGTIPLLANRPYANSTAIGRTLVKLCARHHRNSVCKRYCLDTKRICAKLAEQGITPRQNTVLSKIVAKLQ